jgi:hypothetical protein
MKDFLKKFVKVIAECEKKFSLNSQRIADLNRLLYEYEHLSFEAYSPANNAYLGQVTANQMQSPNSMLFENPDNYEIKANFEQVISQAVNPFTKMRQWLLYEILEIESLKEAFTAVKQIR